MNQQRKEKLLSAIMVIAIWAMVIMLAIVVCLKIKYLFS